MSEEVCQLNGFYDWIETEANKVASCKIFEMFDEEETRNFDMTITEDIIQHELTRFFFISKTEDNINFFIMKDDIIKLIKGLANEITYNLLSKLHLWEVDMDKKLNHARG